MKFGVLGSGSKGNSTYISSGETALLIDAGFSGRETERRLESLGVCPDTLQAILITHEHTDHVRGAGVLSRKYRLPVFVNEPTWQAAEKHLDRVYQIEFFKTGQNFSVSEINIHPFAVSHDSAEAVGFRLNGGDYALGYCTDTGMISRLIRHHLSSCHGLILECNHDLEMLRNGHYPLHLQQRIRSKTGHLANPEAIDFLAELVHPHLRHVVLAHVSESNNCYNLVADSVQNRFNGIVNGSNQDEKGAVGLEISVARQDHPGNLIDLAVPLSMHSERIV